MESSGIGGLAALGAAFVVLTLVISVRRSLKRRRAAGGGAPAPRIEALAAAQADLAARLDALAAGQSAPEERLQAMAGQMLGLIRDKNATMETALAGLDQLRGRMRTLEQMGAPAEARALLERLEARLDEMRSAQAAGAAALEARIAALESPGPSPVAELAERLTRLHAQKDSVAEAVLARLARLEAALAAQDPQAALDRFAERLEELRRALDGRIAALEAPAENPFAEISEQLTRLYAQKDAAVETVFARLAPLETRLSEMQGRIESLDPQAALDRFAERLEAVKAAHAAAETALQGRLTALEAPAENPFAEISEQLTRLYAQKDAAVETVLARLAPLETRLSEMQGRIDGLDPGAALERFAERLEAVKAAHAAAETALQGRLAALEAPAENPFAEISEQLTRLYAQKDATVETVFARLAPLEAKLAEVEAGLASRDPQAALDRFAERLEAVQGRVAALEAPGENPFAEISEQLTRLYTQKDATVETVFARLAPLEARLSEMQGRIDGLDPQAALDRFAERLEGLKAAHAAAETALQGRLAALEAPGENPFAEISEQLTRLYSQKDAAVETVLARLAPLETRLSEAELRLAPLAEADPRAEIDGLAARIESLGWAQGEVAAGLAALKAAGAEAGTATAPLERIADQITRLYAQKDAGLAAVLARLAPLEARLAQIEDRPWDPDAGEARAQARAIAEEMIAARAAAERTELFADRIALLEASLPRLSAAQATLMQALERQGGPATATPAPEGRAAAPAADPAPAAPASLPETAMEEIWTLPRLVSLHRK